MNKFVRFGIALAIAALTIGSGQEVRAGDDAGAACKRVAVSAKGGGSVDPMFLRLLRDRGLTIVESDPDIRIEIATRSNIDPNVEKKYAQWYAGVSFDASTPATPKYSYELLPHHGSVRVNAIPWIKFFEEHVAPEINRADCRKREPKVGDGSTSSSSGSSSSSGISSSSGGPPAGEPPPAPTKPWPAIAGIAGVAGVALGLYAYARARHRAPPPAPPPKKLRILVLASNPADTAPLDLQAEVEEIQAKIRQGTNHGEVELIPHFSVGFDDILRTLNQVRPDIVHVSGHGTKKGEIYLCDAQGLAAPVSEKLLERLFTVLKDDIRVVVLNACHSERQAGAIARVIDCVIGMRRAVPDEAAQAFSASFYRAVASGRDVRNAFDQGCLAIAGMTEPPGPRDRDVAPPSSISGGALPPDEIPTLIERSGVEAADIVLCPGRARGGPESEAA